MSPTEGSLPAPGQQQLATTLRHALAGLLTIICLVWNLDLPQRAGFALLSEQFYALCLGVGLTLAFLTYGHRGQLLKTPDPLSIALALGSLGLLLYVAVNYLHLRDWEYAGSTPTAIWIGAAISLLVLEGLRRSSGYLILAVVLIFIAYGPFGHLVPGPLVGAEVAIWQVFSNFGFSSSAIFGMSIQIAMTVVILFILFGQILFKAGGADFFNDIALGAVGKRPGGAAQICVVGSAAFGVVSGSAVSNVVSSGVVTIPMMIKSGYSRVQAGAIEAVSSTGGQMQPPLMGAAAFLMAEFLQVPYAEVALAAIIPSILYYYSLFVQIDITARRDKIAPVEIAVPRVREVLRDGWHFLIPFFYLTAALFFWNLRVEVAAVHTCAVMLIVGLIFPYRGQRLRLRDTWTVMVETGQNILGLLMIVAAAGMVIGILNLTGLGFALTFFLVDLAGGNLAILLILAAALCVILGMGLPTAAAYIVLAAIAAPALIEAGVPPLAAHMFLLYFGMLSMLTPPIALASFAAASISGASPMKTAVQSTLMGWSAYLVPFLFVLGPGLLLDGTWWQSAQQTLAAIIGIFLVSLAISGYYLRPLSPGHRVLLLALGVLTMMPVRLTGYDGLPGLVAGALGLALLLSDYRRTRADRATS